MKLAVSNIAWDPVEDIEVISQLHEYGVSGIELAPTKHWLNPESATEEEAVAYRQFWISQGLTPVAMQSLLFNRPQLSIFGESTEITFQYLKSIVRLAGRLSTKSLVFGSPKNRLIANGNREELYQYAMDFFVRLGDEASKNGVIICIEPNPKEYGCDFITSSFEGLKFIKEINHDSVKLHLDAGTILLNGEIPETVMERCLPYSGHFHISDPFLLVPGAQQFSHSEIAAALRRHNYNGYVSLEMKNGIHPDDKDSLKEALTYIRQIYLQE